MASRTGSVAPSCRAVRPLRVVLIGTTLGDRSDEVVRAGLAMARATGARVALVHALDVELYPLGLELGVGVDLEREQIARRADLRRQVERLGIREPELMVARVATGAPHRVLTAAARELAADLIVVGATRGGAFTAELLGSTTERMLRKSPCPVLVVREGLRLPPRRVVMPVDLSTLSGDAFHCGLGLLGQLAGGGEMEVEVVHACGILDALRLREKGGGVVSVEEARQLAGESLWRFVLENRAEVPFDLATAVLAGEPRTEILRELAEHPADLLVLGSHGRGGPDRLVLGSVASTLARRAPCSVLLISPEAALAAGMAEAVFNQTEPVFHREPQAVS